MATFTWQQQVARWTNGSEAGRIIACLDRELQSTIRRYASFQETPSLHAKGILGYLNSMYFSILYIKCIWVGNKFFAAFQSSHAQFSWSVSVLETSKGLCDLLGLLCDWLRRRVGLDRVCVGVRGAVCWWDGLVSSETCKFAFSFFVQHWFLMLHVESDGQIVECVLCLFFVCSLF